MISESKHVTRDIHGSHHQERGDEYDRSIGGYIPYYPMKCNSPTVSISLDDVVIYIRD